MDLNFEHTSAPYRLFRKQLRGAARREDSGIKAGVHGILFASPFWKKSSLGRDSIYRAVLKLEGL